MSTDDQELLGLFLQEAGSRLERMHGTDWVGEGDAASRVRIRRELHALKGASRMMGLADIAEICHHAEDVLDHEGELGRIGFETILEELRQMVDDLEITTLPDSNAETTSPGDMATQLSPEVATPTEVRVAASVIDHLADRGARLRVLATGAEGLADRIFRLAALAERGVGERAPEQVLATLATSLRQVGIDLESGQRALRRLTDRHLDTLLSIQVQPLGPFLRVLARHAEELADSLGKKVRLAVDSGEVRLDRRIVDALREAFLHLVRNAVDHGIESPEERVSAGKNETGLLRLEASTGGGRVRIRVVDDGRGIEADTVIDTALARGILSRDDATTLGGSEVLQFLFRPGFTTRQETTEVSGRGVGLDAVATTVRTVGGDVWLESARGAGTSAVVEVPVARRGQRVLVLRVGRHHLAVPAATARSYQRVSQEMVGEVGGRRVVETAGQVVTAHFLSDLLGESVAKNSVLVEMVVGGVVVGVVADEVLGEEEVLIRPIPRAAGAIRAIDGITLLASGRPVPVLSLSRFGPLDRTDPTATEGRSRPVQPIQVLLVDDSDVTREMVRRLLEDAGFDVLGAGSADDALAILEDRDFDCLVTDIEMPGMNGLVLTRMLREDDRFADLPIIVVSTLDRPSDRLAGLEAGADSYLTKQGLDARELVTLVSRLGAGR